MKTLYLITGVGSGIGQALARLLLNQSEAVIGFTRKQSAIADKSYFCCFWDMQYRLKDQNFSLAEVLDKQLKAHHCSKIALVNNAGTLGELGEVLTNDPECIRSTMNINFFAPVDLSCFTADWCLANKVPLSILNLSTGAAKKPIASWSNYCASKAAFDMWSRCLHLESPLNLKVALFYPGVVDTRMQEVIRGTSSKLMPNVQNFIDLKNKNLLLPPEKVAQVIARILSAANFGEQDSYDVRDFIE